MNTKQEFIDNLKHYRHDWLNHVQIIKGYISLNKTEQAQKYLDSVIVNAHYESKISNIGHVDLAYLLLTYNWTQDKIVLDVEIEEDDVEISVIGTNYPYILTWIKEVIALVERNSVCFHDNRLSIVFHLTKNDLVLELEFSGKWTLVEGCFNPLHGMVKKENGSLEVKRSTETEFELEIKTEKR